MPSKTKKQSKTLARLSNSEHSASPQSQFLTSSRDVELSKEDFRHGLEEASSKYPFLIGKSAFIGEVIDSDVNQQPKECQIWLSESSMVAESLASGSLVSVSLAALDTMTKTFPLSSFLDECNNVSEINSTDVKAVDVGNYFALATVLPSKKIVKNGIRLSSNLSRTMGDPSSGRIVFVYPMLTQFLTDSLNGNDKPLKPVVNHFLMHKCAELHLQHVDWKNRVDTNSKSLRSPDIASETSHSRSKIGPTSSPKTPSSKSKFYPPSIFHLDSPSCEEPVSLVASGKSRNDTIKIAEILKDESAKKIMQTCANSWLRTRSLLPGNLVAIPILSELCFFHVIHADKLPSGDGNQDSVHEKDSLYQKASHSTNLIHDAYVVTHETKMHFYLPSGSASGSSATSGLPCVQLKYDNVKGSTTVHDVSVLGGLSKEYAILMDIIISSSVKETLTRLGLRSTKGVLLHGPPGTGKTSLAHLCCRDAGVNFFSVNGPEIVSQYHGESEQALHEVFESASQAAPSVVFIDELDAIAPSRKDGGEALSQRMVATLLNLMDGVSSAEGVLVIAATNRPDSIDAALRRPGRLDREIEIGVPSPTQRSNILQTLLNGVPNSLSVTQVQQLAMTTHGFVGADLAALCNAAALICLRRYVKLNKFADFSRRITVTHKRLPVVAVDMRDSFTDSVASNVLDFSVFNENSPSSGETNHMDEDMLKVDFDDFENARMKVRPSAMREVILEVPKVKWEDVGGQQEVKAQLIEAVEWPQKHEDAFKRIGTRPPTGVLMFGPPGCSKTLMARAVASEAGVNFLAVKGPELFSKWVGESEKAVRSVFAKARENAPSIIFFDEIDGLAVIRGKESDGVSVSDRVMSQLLVELDGLHQRVNVTVIAATNRPDKIDPALMRPGRFDRLVYVGPPNDADRKEIFSIHLRKISCSCDVSIEELAVVTDGYTGADISSVCREAAIAAIEEDIDASQVTMKHLKNAIRRVKPSDLHSYEELSAKFQRLVQSTAERDHVERKESGSFIRSLVKSFTQLIYRTPSSLIGLKPTWSA